MPLPVYLDNHATTRVDPRVVEAMLPYFTESYGNAASTSHSFGWEAKEAVDAARESIAAAIGASRARSSSPAAPPRATTWRSAAWPSAQRRRGNHLVTRAHRAQAVLDPLERLGRRGFEVTLLAVEQAGSDRGRAGSIRDSVADCAARRHAAGLGDAGQQRDRRHPAAGRDRRDLPRARRARALRRHAGRRQDAGRRRRAGRRPDELFGPQDLRPQGRRALCTSAAARRRCGWSRRSPAAATKAGLRSGTLNVPGIVGFARALELCLDEMPQRSARGCAALRDRLYAGPDCERAGRTCTLNGPVAGASPALRLAGQS